MRKTTNQNTSLITGIINFLNPRESTYYSNLLGSFGDSYRYSQNFTSKEVNERVFKHIINNYSHQPLPKDVKTKISNYNFKILNYLVEEEILSCRKDGRKIYAVREGKRDKISETLSKIKPFVSKHDKFEDLLNSTSLSSNESLPSSLALLQALELAQRQQMLLQRQLDIQQQGIHQSTQNEEHELKNYLTTINTVTNNKEDTGDKVTSEFLKSVDSDEQYSSFERQDETNTSSETKLPSFLELCSSLSNFNGEKPCNSSTQKLPSFTDVKDFINKENATSNKNLSQIDCLNFQPQFFQTIPISVDKNAADTINTPNSLNNQVFIYKR